jgi:hypothetical protein
MPGQARPGTVLVQQYILLLSTLFCFFKFVFKTMGEIPGDPGLFPVLAALVAVVVLLTLFILPDYICWKRRLRQLPHVTAHQIQFSDEETALKALEIIQAVPPSQQFEKFIEISRAMTKTKTKRAGSDGLLFDGKFSVGEMPEEYAALERALFSYSTPVDKAFGPIQTHLDGFHLAFITDRHDPVAEKRKEKIQKKIDDQKLKTGKEGTNSTRGQKKVEGAGAKGEDDDRKKTK